MQLAFIAILYWWAAINLDFWMQQNINTTFLLSVVLLRYVPSIMLICAYMILYFQMARLFVLSRIQSSETMHTKLSQT